ncbi:hypothetical protein Rleg9DRAFT_2988 [Rhizobium leguminosarum bv. trifolii WSM597]|uniref:Uncharacterized protein n=1 Tax=Rhizobium leguminosarum bv. trifolii WSM597 TaxID=754764 RepID=J0H297_RHILT|nr:hypothetical protein Rleg9DRAFT_2988 [Rhizobium leguminosarum bv. trifolii WSM597]
MKRFLQALANAYIRTFARDLGAPNATSIASLAVGRLSFIIPGQPALLEKRPEKTADRTVRPQTRRLALYSRFGLLRPDKDRKSSAT